MIDAWRVAPRGRERATPTDARPAGRSGAVRTACGVLAGAACYYFATQVAWFLCFPDSKVSLFFPPHAVLLSILLLVPTRRWWAYVLAAGGAHFLATRQAHWPPWYALHCEVFDAVKCVLAAAGVRLLIRSPLKALTLRDAVLFVLVAVALVPFGTAFWGAALTISHGFGTYYWIEWRNLGVSNAVTTVVLTPAILLGAHHLFVRRPRVPVGRALEAVLAGALAVAIGVLVFDQTSAGPNTSPPLLYTPIPLLIWAALRFGLGGISAAMLVVTFLAIWGTMRGHGPFLAQTPPENALSLQLFLLMTAAPLMFLAVVIEQERRAKEALRESKDRMGLAAEAANLSMWVWDVSGDDGWMTERGRSLLGLEPDARVDYAAILDRVHPDDRAAREDAIRHALETRGEYDLEYRVQHADGAVRWIHARGRCGAYDGAGLKLVGVSMDVTARKQAEASAAREREELEALGRVALLGEMAASVAHEVNQPLAAMVANASAAQRFLAQGDGNLQEVAEILADIAADGHRAGDVIDSIKAMVRKTEGRRSVLDVNGVVADVVRLARRDAGRRGCELTTDLEPVLPRVLGDRVQFQQVLLNLVINAFDAMGATPGAAAPDACRVEIATRRIDGEVEVSVRDRGPGLAAEARARVFERFYSTKREGMGMGLAIARSIIEAHAGTLDAANADGGGARFWFRVPAHEDAAAATA